jgi:hypothetical protein
MNTFRKFLLAAIFLLPSSGLLAQGVGCFPSTPTCTFTESTPNAYECFGLENNKCCQKSVYSVLCSDGQWQVKVDVVIMDNRNCNPDGICEPR